MTLIIFKFSFPTTLKGHRDKIQFAHTVKLTGTKCVLGNSSHFVPVANSPSTHGGTKFNGTGQINDKRSAGRDGTYFPSL